MIGEQKEMLSVDAMISMLPGFHKLMHHLIEGKSPEFLEGFFEGMMTMKKIDIGEDIFKDR